MRLLNTETLQVKEFEADIPRYAILSHTWEKEEITFQDIQDLEAAKFKHGYIKVWNACLHARRYNFEWIWIDSCCINKESSAELSEALNSMFQYYEDSEVCYAYLCDASSKEDPRNVRSAFKRSKWFTRGWTLQELLAPSHVVFLDKGWNEIGTRWSLRDAISAITSIPVQVFWGTSIETFSIAQRMSWAAYRETTKPEDQAYSLMGIFGVSMPPLYGEGFEKAFMRLQQEIIKYSGDRSIFAWISDNSWQPRGLFARSPYEFRASGKVTISDSDAIGNKSPFSFGNNGLHIHLPLEPTDESGVSLASLNCRTESDGSYISVYLRSQGGHYVRDRADQLVLTSTSPSLENVQELVVKGEVSHKVRRKQPESDPVLYIELLPSAENSFALQECRGTSFYNHTVTLREHTGASLRYRSQDGTMEFCVLMHYDSELMVAFHLITDRNDPNLKITGLADVYWPCYADRILEPLNSGGQISLAIQMTGNRPDHRMLEIDYIPSQNVDISSLTPRQFRFAKFDFECQNTPFSLQHVYPSDLCQRVFDDSNSVFISIPDSTIKDPSGTFRILTFEGELFRGESILHVAVGFHESKPWIDVFLADPKDQSETTEEIWKSYLDSGSRAQKRLKYRTAASVVHSAKENINYLSLTGIDSVTRSTVTAVIEKRKTLQIGTHGLCFKIDNQHVVVSPHHENWQSPTMPEVIPPKLHKSQVPVPRRTLLFTPDSPISVPSRHQGPLFAPEPLPLVPPSGTWAQLLDSRVSEGIILDNLGAPTTATQPRSESPSDYQSDVHVGPPPAAELELSETDDQDDDSVAFYSPPSSPPPTSSSPS
ncbi:hypothetical protein VKT23_008048 [Stygiomarasmius scandens]|uniref:Heterokaryon incompatibility domain-containing protein n=1 Tax=Marasmiellus scandens TaxID=2682957 RepID=A0ABR1JJ55_9AGAR